jgi:hypothetical protein
MREPAGLFPPSWQQCHCTMFLQAPELPLPAHVVPLTWQRLPWLLVVGTSKQAPGLLLSAGLVPPVSAAAPLDCASGSPDWQSGFRTSAADRLGSPKLAAAIVTPDSPHRQVGPRAPATRSLGSSMPAALLHCSSRAHNWKSGPRTPAAQRLDSPVPAAVARAPGSRAPTSKPQGSCCLQTWVPYACSSCHGCWKPMPQY